MTTIIATNKQMAADRALVVDGACAETVKIFRIGDKLVGTAGGNEEGETFLRWMRKGGKRPKMDKEGEFCALVLSKKGIAYYDYGCHAMPLKNKVWAIGSGGAFALAAFAAGENIKRAVEIACQFDGNSRPPVDVFTL